MRMPRLAPTLEWALESATTFKISSGFAGLSGKHSIFASVRHLLPKSHNFHGGFVIGKSASWTRVLAKPGESSSGAIAQVMGMMAWAMADVELSLLRPKLSTEPIPARFWIHQHGSVSHAMPSFSHLPQQQRWQAIMFLKILRVQKKAVCVVCHRAPHYKRTIASGATLVPDTRLTGFHRYSRQARH